MMPSKANTHMMKHSLPILTLGCLAACAQAGSEIAPPPDSPARALFDHGSHELQIGIGWNHSTASGGPLRPVVDDVAGALRLGWMLNSPGGTGFFRGNCEFLIEAVAGGIVEGAGSVLAGGTLILRYNFIKDSARWLPYIQAGLGAVYADAYRQRPQRLLGEGFEFTMQGEIGVRYLITPHTAVYVETGYRHISNAGLADRNLGLNSVTAEAGVSCFW